MRQRIVHGTTIDTITPAEMADLLSRTVSREAVEEYDRRRGVIALDGTGAGTQKLSLPSQYDWLCERMALTGAAATFTFYENEVSSSNFLAIATVPASGFYSDAFSNNLYMPAHTTLVVVVSGGPLSGYATFNLQIKLKEHRRGR